VKGASAPLRLVLASNNAKKLSELSAMLSGLNVALVAQGELGIPEAPEPHCTFIENGLAKARHAAAAANGPAIADDSGVCIESLNGEPGVNSANFASVALPGARKSPREADREARRRVQDAANNQMLLQRLGGAADRRAYFVSTLVAVRHAADPEPLVAVGRWPGELLEAPRGELGFGYDPLMFIPELGLTVAEMTPEMKNQHSHRARAMRQMLQLLQEVWHL
jgi:XTP/dITP diphosphohydrolase